MSRTCGDVLDILRFCFGNCKTEHEAEEKVNKFTKPQHFIAAKNQNKRDGITRKFLPKVRISIHPNVERIPRGDQKPLANIKLCFVDQKRPFNVLLHNVTALMSAAFIDDGQDIFKLHI